MLHKSNRNKETGEWAEYKKYYDVAVSRYYYSLFQKIVQILNNKNHYKEPPEKINSHAFIIDLFREKRYIIDPNQISWIEQLHHLRKLRNDCDYKPLVLDKNKFDLQFKYKFSKINEILDTLLK